MCLCEYCKHNTEASPGFDECEVSSDGFFHHEVATVEDTRLTRLADHFHRLVLVVFDGEPAFLDDGA